MFRNARRGLIASAISALMVAPATSAARPVAHELNAQPPRFTVTVLGTLGGTFSQAGGLNNRGEVAGFSALPGDQTVHAFLWDRGAMTDLGTLGGPDSFTQESYAVNDFGVVTGDSETSRPDPNGEDFCNQRTLLTCLPYVWRNGEMTALPTLGGNNGFGSAINDLGQIVGVAETSIPDPTCAPPLFLGFDAAIWQNGQIRELPPLTGDPDGIANAINQEGEIVGASGTCTLPLGGGLHALIWRDGKPIDLGNLGGATGNYADAINDRGQIVGQSGLAGDTTAHAFLWQNGTMTDLGTLPGLPFSAALGINNDGQVVGISAAANGPTTGAWLWQNGVITDLNTLIRPNSPISLLEALGINNNGQIAGYGLLPDGTVHGYLLTPCRSTSRQFARTAQRRTTTLNAFAGIRWPTLGAAPIAQGRW